MIVMDAPTHLSHTPIVSWNDYDKTDGKFAGNTDAMALSIGFAQYADEETINRCAVMNNFDDATFDSFSP